MMRRKVEVPALASRHSRTAPKEASNSFGKAVPSVAKNPILISISANKDVEEVEEEDEEGDGKSWLFSNKRRDEEA